MDYSRFREIGIDFAEDLRKYFDSCVDSEKKISCRQQILKLSDLKRIIEEFGVFDLKGELKVYKQLNPPYIKIQDNKFIICCPEHLKDGTMAIAVMNGLGKILLNRDNIGVCDGWKLDDDNFKESKDDYLIAEAFSQAFVMPKDLFYYYLNMYTTLDDTCYINKIKDEFQVEDKHVIGRGKTLGLFRW